MDAQYVIIGATTLAPTSVTGPSTTVTLDYNGATIGSFTITASAPGSTSVSEPFTVNPPGQTVYVIDSISPQFPGPGLEFYKTLSGTNGVGLSPRTGIDPNVPQIANTITAGRIGDIFIGSIFSNFVSHYPPNPTPSTAPDYSEGHGAIGDVAEDSSGGVWIGLTSSGGILHYPAGGSASNTPDRQITGIAGLPPSYTFDSSAVSVDSQDRVYTLAGPQGGSTSRVYVLPANSSGVATPVASYPYDGPPVSFQHVTIDQHDDTIWEYPVRVYAGGSPVPSAPGDSPIATNGMAAVKQGASAASRALYLADGTFLPQSAAFDDRQNVFAVYKGGQGGAVVDVWDPTQSGAAAPRQITSIPSAAAIAIAVTTFGLPPAPPGGSPNSGIARSPNSFSFLATGAAYASALTVSESGYSGSFVAASANTGIATVAPGSAARTFTVTPVNAGNTTVRVSDSSGGYADVPVAVTITALNAQGRRR